MLPIQLYVRCTRAGITHGSMSPHSKYLWQEGASFKSFKIVAAGEFQEAELRAHLLAPAQHPGCSVTRLMQDNLSDQKAQIAANHKASSSHRAVFQSG